MEKWPPMRLDNGLQVGSKGGHSVICYRVTEYVPGKRVEFTFTPMPNLQRFVGRHVFEVITRPHHTLLRHTIDVETDLASWIHWKLFIECIHDAVIEDAFDKAQRYAGIVTAHPAKWSLYVRLWRWCRSRKHIQHPPAATD